MAGLGGLDGLDGRTFEGSKVSVFVGSKVTSPRTGANVDDRGTLGVAVGAHSFGIRMHAAGLGVLSSGEDDVFSVGSNEEFDPVGAGAAFGGANGAHNAGINVQTVGLIGISAGDNEGLRVPRVGTCVLTESGGEGRPRPGVGSIVLLNDGLDVGAAMLEPHKSGMRMQRVGFETLSAGETGGGTEPNAGALVLSAIGVEGRGAELAGGGRELGAFVLSNVGEGEIVGAHNEGISMQTDGLMALSPGGNEGISGSLVGDVVLVNIGVELGGEPLEGVDPGSRVGTCKLRTVGAGVGKAKLGEIVGAHNAGIKMQTVGLN